MRESLAASPRPFDRRPSVPLCGVWEGFNPVAALNSLSGDHTRYTPLNPHPARPTDISTPITRRPWSRTTPSTFPPRCCLVKRRVAGPRHRDRQLVYPQCRTRSHDTWLLATRDGPGTDTGPLESPAQGNRSTTPGTLRATSPPRTLRLLRLSSRVSNRRPRHRSEAVRSR